ncbi:nuclear transport factor 2 family protein [Nocardia sp. BMG51109]|uniref:nuclear transport factor 2 family protein n=1 Tax=Nocardia sp. BMG51109 TaxID=1056816 RepID=UPI00046598FB|nr:nuclear transport factor 2 family protein [Nocardia sp. BMG51109]
MLALQEMSDRLEIQDLTVRYAHAVDTHQWDLLDDLFTPDAHIDFSATGAPTGGLAGLKEFLAQVLPNFVAHQHFLSNWSITVDGDTAAVRTMCHNPMVVADQEGRQTLMQYGLWYVDDLRRVDGRWRIARREQEKSYAFVGSSAVGP